MKYLIISFLLFFQIKLGYGQSSLEDYEYFTPERRLVLKKMGEFFDRAIREDFRASTDTCLNTTWKAMLHYSLFL